MANQPNEPKPFMINVKTKDEEIAMQPLPQPNENNQESQQPELDAHGWPIGFFEETVGCFQGEPLLREPQGEYEERLELE
jgi:hypothetical protein